MKKRGNGSGHNGAGSDPAPKKLVVFPDKATRRKLREEKEKQWQAKYKQERRRPPVPFINLSRVPLFTRYSILSFILVYGLLQIFMGEAGLYELFYTYGFVPGFFTGVTENPSAVSWLSPLTYQFLHGSWVHLLINTLMMLSIGMFFESEFGTKATVFFFFVCGFAGAAFYFALNPFSTAPVIGASASISGLMGAIIILLFQRQNAALHKIRKYGPWPLIGFWILFMAGMGYLSGDAVAWQAHVGGFLAGIGLLHLMQKGKLRFR